MLPIPDMIVSVVLLLLLIKGWSYVVIATPVARTSNDSSVKHCCLWDMFRVLRDICYTLHLPNLSSCHSRGSKFGFGGKGVVGTWCGISRPLGSTRGIILTVFESMVHAFRVKSVLGSPAIQRIHNSWALEWRAKSWNLVVARSSSNLMCCNWMIICCETFWER